MNNYFYLCDGKACSRNCAENGFDSCKHTKNGAHAKNKIRRERKFVKEGSFMVEHVNTYKHMSVPQKEE